MKGVNAKLGFNLLSKMDETITSIIKYYEEVRKQNKKDHAKKPEEQDKLQEK